VGIPQLSRRIAAITLILVWVAYTSAADTELQGKKRNDDQQETLVVRWNNAFLEAVRESKLGPPMVARALAIAHTCMYDAWAAYDARAHGTQFGSSLRTRAISHSYRNTRESMSFAAYRAGVDLFPGQKSSVFDPVMKELGYDETNASVDVHTPAGLGNVACAAVLSYRHHDGANQLGDLSPSGLPYADWTDYHAVNASSTVPVLPSLLSDPSRWEPLQYLDVNGTLVTQAFLGAQWYRVKPFALTSPDQFRSFVRAYGPAQFGSDAFREQASELIELSANLTDDEKMIAEYWKDGPHSETPPGHWCLFAQLVSRRDHHTIDDDVKMFFALTNALFDASIAAWDAKRAFDSVRPATAIPYLFTGVQIRSWGGPGKGTVTLDGADWKPYQPGTFPTPPFPEYISGHSTFSTAAATVLRLWTGDDKMLSSVTFAPGSSEIEPGVVPVRPVTLKWTTFSQAAEQAGMSRRYGGIHFRAADLIGQAVGHLVGVRAYEKALSYIDPQAVRSPLVVDDAN